MSAQLSQLQKQVTVKPALRTENSQGYYTHTCNIKQQKSMFGVGIQKVANSYTLRLLTQTHLVWFWGFAEKFSCVLIAYNVLLIFLILSKVSSLFYTFWEEISTFQLQLLLADPNKTGIWYETFYKAKMSLNVKSLKDLRFLPINHQSHSIFIVCG